MFPVKENQTHDNGMRLLSMADLLQYRGWDEALLTHGHRRQARQDYQTRLDSFIDSRNSGQTLSKATYH